MTDLPPYERTFSFAGFEANKPSDPPPGVQIDRELDDIAARLQVVGKSAYELAVLEGFTGSRGAWLLSLIGPQGLPGPQGAPGLTGPQGAQGAAGATGAQGAQGLTGPQGAQGLTGPQGAQGAAGATGAQGAQGPQGNPTTVNGKTGASITLNAGDVGAPKIIGDTYTGQHFIPLAANSVSSRNISQRTEGGSWQTDAATKANGWPEDTNGFYHLIGTTHDNLSNYYSMQIAGGFADNNNFFIRKTNNNGLQPWRTLWHDGNVPVLGQKINFRQKKFVLSDFGAVGNINDAATKANNATAIVAARDALLTSSRGGTIVVDDNYVFDRGFDWTIPAGVGLVLEGGTSSCGMYWDGSGVVNGVVLRAGAYSTGRLGLRGLRLSANNCPNIGYFIYVRGSGDKRSMIIDDLYIEGSPSARPSNFLTIVNPYNQAFERINIEAGSVGSYGSTGAGISVSGDKQLGAGICVDFAFRDCNITRVNVGFDLVADSAPGAHTLEGAMFDGCIVAGVQTGLSYVSYGDIVPGMYWRGGHINASRYGIVLSNIAQFRVSDTLIYMDVSGPPLAAVQVQGACLGIDITGNNFYMPDTTVTGARPGLNHIIITGNSKQCRVAMNTFQAYTADPYLRIDAGCDRTDYGFNRKAGGGGNSWSDNGSNSVNYGGNSVF